MKDNKNPNKLVCIARMEPTGEYKVKGNRTIAVTEKVVQRVPRHQAQKLVDKGWNFVSKQVWKRFNRKGK